jgi:putative ABC transport system ATP-binding protein
MIRAEGLSKEYMSGGQPLRVLDRVDLHVEPESFVAVVGPSGSGKTTLLGLLAGLDEPTEGTVTVAGENLQTLTEDGRARFRAENVGFVFQTFHLLPTLTALENVMVPLELRDGASHEDGRAIRERAMTLLERVELGERGGHYPAQLSGGEQQRVALARAFANGPRILFADEPTGNLDRRTGQRVVDLMEEINQELKTTLVLVTHDLDLAARAQRTISLEDGRIVSDEARRSNPEDRPSGLSDRGGLPQ